MNIIPSESHEPRAKVSPIIDRYSRTDRLVAGAAALVIAVISTPNVARGFEETDLQEVSAQDCPRCIDYGDPWANLPPDLIPGSLDDSSFKQIPPPPTSSEIRDQFGTFISGVADDLMDGEVVQGFMKGDIDTTYKIKAGLIAANNAMKAMNPDNWVNVHFDKKGIYPEIRTSVGKNGYVRMMINQHNDSYEFEAVPNNNFSVGVARNSDKSQFFHMTVRDESSELKVMFEKDPDGTNKGVWAGFSTYLEELN